MDSLVMADRTGLVDPNRIGIEVQVFVPSREACAWELFTRNFGSRLDLG
jgi:hypothetical protein